MHSTNKQTPRWLVLAFTFLVVMTLGVVVFSRSSSTFAASEATSLDASTKTATPDSVSPGGTVDFEVVLRNESGSTGQILVTDTLPSELTYVSGSVLVAPEGKGVGYPSGDDVLFTVFNMDASEVVTLSFTAGVDGAVAPNTTITNTASIGWSGGLLDRSVEVFVEAVPESQITDPWPNALVKAGSTVSVSGRAWTASQGREFPDAPVLDIASGGATTLSLSWNSVSGAIKYFVEEADSVDFSNITHDEETANLYLHRTSLENGTYYYRVRAWNGYGYSTYSNVVSATVASATTSVGYVASTPDMGIQVAAYQPGVEVNFKMLSGGTDDWQTVSPANVTADSFGDWWNWSYDLDIPDDAEAGDQYVIQTRASNEAGSPGEVDTVTVTVSANDNFVYLPWVVRQWPPMTTLSVTSDDGEGNYSLSWTTTASAWGVVSYRFQESKSEDFDVLTRDESLSGTTRDFIDHDSGIYYHRVGAVNANGEIGAWSNVVSVESTGDDYYEDFSDDSSGWPEQVYYRGTDPDGPFFDVQYESGSYRAKILLSFTGANNRWMGIVEAPWENPNDNYEVEVEHWFTVAEDQASAPSLGKAGLIFASNDDLTVFYQVEWNFEGDCAAAKYWSIAPPGTTWNPANIAMAKTWGSCSNVLNVGYDQHNVAKVTVVNNIATVYLNDQQITTVNSDDFYTYDTVGISTGAFDRTPVESRFDEFKVTGQ